jgi:hypothetical protein
MRVLLAVAGAAAGFFFAGPLGAGAGAAGGMLLGSFLGSKGEDEGPTGEGMINGWEPAIAVSAPGDYKWFDQLAEKKAKALVRFRIMRGVETTTVTAKVVRVYAVNGVRYWVVAQISTAPELPNAPPTGSLWTIVDAVIESGSNGA